MVVPRLPSPSFCALTVLVPGLALLRQVIESADKDRHLLGLENARLQRTVELYRNQFGDVEPLPADPTAQPY